MPVKPKTRIATPKPCRPDSREIYVGSQRHKEHRPPITIQDTKVFFDDLDRYVKPVKTKEQNNNDYDRETGWKP